MNDRVVFHTDKARQHNFPLLRDVIIIQDLTGNSSLKFNSLNKN